jgi:hypothetical protein
VWTFFLDHHEISFVILNKMFMQLAVVLAICSVGTVLGEEGVSSNHHAFVEKKLHPKVNGLKLSLSSHEDLGHRNGRQQIESGHHHEGHHLRSSSVSGENQNNHHLSQDNQPDVWLDQRQYYEHVYYNSKNPIEKNCETALFKYVTKVDSCIPLADSSKFYKLRVKANPAQNYYQSFVEYYSDAHCEHLDRSERIDSRLENILMCTYLAPHFFRMNHAIDLPLNPKQDSTGFAIFTYRNHAECVANDYRNGVIDAVYMSLNLCNPAETAADRDQKWIECSKENGLVQVEFSSNDGTCSGDPVSTTSLTHSYTCGSGSSSLAYGTGWLSFICSETAHHHGSDGGPAASPTSHPTGPQHEVHPTSHPSGSPVTLAVNHNPTSHPTSRPSYVVKRTALISTVVGTGESYGPEPQGLISSDTRITGPYGEFVLYLSSWCLIVFFQDFGLTQFKIISIILPFISILSGKLIPLLFSLPLQESGVRQATVVKVQTGSMH